MKHLLVAISAVASLLLVSCSSDTSPSGFLPNYSQLGGGYDTANSVAGYLNTEADLGKYDSILFEPVVTIVDAQNFDPQVAEQLAAFLHEALRAEFGKKVKLVNVPGPTTLRARTALTDIIAGSPATEPVTRAHPNPKAPLTGNLELPATADFISTVSFEAEVVDSVTGERLVAVSDQRYGVKRKATPETSWSEIEALVREGAANLRRRTEAVAP